MPLLLNIGLGVSALDAEGGTSSTEEGADDVEGFSGILTLRLGRLDFLDWPDDTVSELVGEGKGGKNGEDPSMGDPFSGDTASKEGELYGKGGLRGENDCCAPKNAVGVLPTRMEAGPELM